MSAPVAQRHGQREPGYSKGAAPLRAATLCVCREISNLDRNVTDNDIKVHLEYFVTIPLTAFTSLTFSSLVYNHKHKTADSAGAVLCQWHIEEVGRAI